MNYNAAGEVIMFINFDRACVFMFKNMVGCCGPFQSILNLTP
jgi:hypothetical protein